MYFQVINLTAKTFGDASKSLDCSCDALPDNYGTVHRYYLVDGPFGFDIGNIDCNPYFGCNNCCLYSGIDSNLHYGLDNCKGLPCFGRNTICLDASY